MPFNMAVAGIGGRTFILAPLTLEDLSLAYNVEAEVLSQFPLQGATRATDQIQLTMSGVDFVAASRTGYAIDADGLHDLAVFSITMLSGCHILGRGGKGGKGGEGFEFEESNGVAGLSGGLAMRFGCETNIVGTGTIERGYGGGGGGAGNYLNGPQIGDGGGGGGGGVPFGAGGNGGLGNDNDGTSGTAATIVDKGVKGTSAIGGDGGDGGENATPAQAGQNAGGQLGGAAGADADAIDSQEFTHSEGGSITVIGDII